MKEYRQGGNLKQELSKVEYMTMATLSGAFTLAMTNPIWVAKTRLCLQYDNELRDSRKGLPTRTTYSGMANCLWKTFEMEGIAGLYKGFLPGLVGTSHGTVQFVSYESMKNSYCRWYHGKEINTQLVGFIDTFVCFVGFTLVGVGFGDVCSVGDEFPGYYLSWIGFRVMGLAPCSMHLL